MYMLILVCYEYICSGIHSHTHTKSVTWNWNSSLFPKKSTLPCKHSVLVFVIFFRALVVLKLPFPFKKLLFMCHLKILSWRHTIFSCSGCMVSMQNLCDCFSLYLTEPWITFIQLKLQLLPSMLGLSHYGMDGRRKNVRFVTESESDSLCFRNFARNYDAKAQIVQ